MTRPGSWAAQPSAPSAVSPAAADLVVRIAARMRADPAEAFPLDVLAAEAGMSRYQLLRLFRAATGRTPHAFLTELRIARARALLAEGLPAAEVAIRCGFFDQPHFTRAFKRAVGATPAQFARAAADGPPEPPPEPPREPPREPRAARARLPRAQDERMQRCSIPTA
jgi:transcriptional regulator GlxA family with amidase domain